MNKDRLANIEWELSIFNQQLKRNEEMLKYSLGAVKYYRTEIHRNRNRINKLVKQLQKEKTK